MKALEAEAGLDAARADMDNVSDNDSDKQQDDGDRENASTNAGASKQEAVPDVRGMQNMKQLTQKMSGLDANLNASLRKRCNWSLIWQHA